MLSKTASIPCAFASKGVVIKSAFWTPYLCKTGLRNSFSEFWALLMFSWLGDTVYMSALPLFAIATTAVVSGVRLAVPDYWSA